MAQKRTRRAIGRPKKRQRMMAKPRRSLRTVHNEVHRFKRSFLSNSVQGNAAFTPYTSGNTITLSQIPAYTEIVNLFDVYKISYVKIRFFLDYDPSAQTAATSYYPKLYFCTDVDDASQPLSLQEFRERSNTQIRVLTPQRPVTFGWRPNTLQMIYRSLSTTAYVPKWNQWIDTDTADVPHYGYKWAIDYFNNTNYAVRAEMTVWFQGKNTK